MLKKAIQLWKEYRSTKLEKYILKEQQLMVVDLVKEARIMNDCTKCPFAMICTVNCVPCDSKLVQK